MKKIILFFFLFLLFFQTEAHWVTGEQSSFTEKEIQREKRELQRLKSKLSTESEKVKKETKREKSILKQLGSINEKLTASQKDLGEHNNNLKITKKKLKKIEARLNKKRKIMKNKKELLQKRLRVIYKEGEPSYLRIVFSASDANDFLQRLKYMKIIANLDADLIAQYKFDTENLMSTKIELQKTVKKVAHYKGITQNKKFEILKEKRNKQEFLSKIRNRKSTYIKTQKELLQASKELSSLIAILEKNYLEEKNMSFYERKGFLPWPVRGKIISPFGKVKNKQFKTVSYNNGIEIAVPVGKNVRAIHMGEVLYSSNLKGYGLMVILGHGKGYYSLYAHLKRSLVKKGDRVRKNQVFAYSGDSDSINGPSLYFEIRSKRVPENPLKWLSIAKK